MRLRSIVAAVGLLSASLAARASSFQFTFGDASSPFSGSGILTTGNVLASGEYQITNVTGSASELPNGPQVNIESILQPGTFPTVQNGGAFPANDNVLFAFGNEGTLTVNGLSFLLTDGAQINLASIGNGTDGALLTPASGANLSEVTPVNITAVAATPEPTSFALLGSGLLGIAGMLKRRSA